MILSVYGVKCLYSLSHREREKKVSAKINTIMYE